jgi:hypothetical protein
VGEGGGPNSHTHGLTLYVAVFTVRAFIRGSISCTIGDGTRTRRGHQGTRFLVVGGSNKRHKPKGTHHAFDLELLENPYMQVEMGWENEKEEYWSSKTCKYMKMYHINKLWAKECHAVYTKSFACRP